LKKPGFSIPSIPEAERTLLVRLLLGLWATVGKISIVATAPGKFIPDGRVKEVQPLESSIVKAIHVKEGQRVQQGDLLLELDPTLSAAEMEERAGTEGGSRQVERVVRPEVVACARQRTRAKDGCDDRWSSGDPGAVSRDCRPRRHAVDR
jgi:multidrug efflux pump subunit AcrA (membrane-fusion protein)